MKMPRPQFTLRALLAAMLFVAAFFGGAAWQRGQTGLKLWRNEQRMQKMERTTQAAVNEAEALRRRMAEGN